MGADDFDVMFDTGQGGHEAQGFAHASIAGFEEGQRNGMPQIGRVAGGGHIALIMGGIDRAALGHQMRAGGHGFGAVHRAQADEAPSLKLSLWS